VFAGGVVKAAADFLVRRRSPAGGAQARAESPQASEESELGPGNLFATGLVAGGAVAGVVFAVLMAVSDRVATAIGTLSIEHALAGKLGPGGYQLLGLACFTVMALTLFNVARGKRE
jgi:hypothetical protein